MTLPLPAKEHELAVDQERLEQAVADDGRGPREVAGTTLIPR